MLPAVAKIIGRSPENKFVSALDSRVFNRFVCPPSISSNLCRRDSLEKLLATTSATYGDIKYHGLRLSSRNFG